MTHLLSPEEVAEFQEIFNLVDRDGGGSITKEELGELMDTLGIDASPEEVDLMIREVCLFDEIPCYQHVFHTPDLNCFIVIVKI